MERLTVKCDDGHWGLSFTVYDRAVPSRILEKLPIAIDRLAAYEDTGLDPEELKEFLEDIESRFIFWVNKRWGIPAGRHIEIMQAEKDGRLMVLPCKRGDTLWSLYNYPTKGICEIVITAVSTLDGVTVINTNNFGVLSEEDVGKTVFLTRKEAEAALKKREEEDDEH